MRATPLLVKLLRDLRRMWAQSLAIALVLAAGAATLVLAVGAHDALDRTRAAYYATYGFAEVFGTVTRAPLVLGAEIRRIDGVVAADLRIRRFALLDVAGMDEPGTVQMVSLPGAHGQPLNRLHLRAGRLPEASGEAAVSEGLAAAHGLAPGARLALVMNGRRQEVRVTGIALSPEFVYALGPGDLMPDERHFGIVWAPYDDLAAAYDLKGAFSDVVLDLSAGADADSAVMRLDAILSAYGGTGATLRDDQPSHAFLDAELRQLRTMSRILPPIFLTVAAFLVNMTMSRLIALEREQIGLLKALGYGSSAIGRHYLGFALVIALAGTVIGLAAGSALGAGLAGLYASFFHFPFLVFSRDPQVYAAAALVTFAAAGVGALRAVRAAVRLPPAVAMAPPAPPRYRRGLLDPARGGGRTGQAGVMVVRHLTHAPVRTVMSVAGVAFAVAILVGSLWAPGSIAKMIRLTFEETERQQATLSFVTPAAPSVLSSVRALPGVLQAEPFRTVAVTIAHDGVARRTSLTGRPAGTELSQVLDRDEAPLPMPPSGLVLSEALADILQVRPGDRVEVTRPDGDRRSFTMQVAAISAGYFGLGAYADLAVLDRALGEGPRISGVNLAIDPDARPAFNRAVKRAPAIAAVVQLQLSLVNFRATMAQNITIMTTVYTTLAAVIAIGVVYNFARIALSEQGRELASLRVLGFTRGEVAAILLRELAIVVVLAQPAGWLFGYGFARAVVSGLSSELYRVPLVMEPRVFALASAIVLTAAAATGLLIRRRIDRLDMIEVLKTRE